jgi:hypothetical protein
MNISIEIRRERKLGRGRMYLNLLVQFSVFFKPAGEKRIKDGWALVESL